MQLQNRRAVSPIIATLLLIAIAVASGVVVYVFTNGLASNLTKSHVGQLTEQVSMDAYNYASPPSLAVYVRNTGTGTINMTSVYFNGNVYSLGASTFATTSGTSCHVSTNSGKTVAMSCSPGGTGSITLSEAATPETSNTVKIITTDGGIFSFNVVAGQTG